MENQEFISFVNDLHKNVLHVDTLQSPFTTEDSGLVLRSISGIAHEVHKEIKRVFGASKSMSDAELAAYLKLESTLIRLRAQERLRLAAIQDFEQVASRYETSPIRIPGIAVN